MKTFNYILTLSIMIGFSACGNSEPVSTTKEDSTTIATKTIRTLGVDLEWQSEVDTQKSWQDAQSYCEDKGMRLPSPREFFALLDTNQSIDVLFPSDTKEFWTNASFNENKAWKITTWSSTQSYHDKNQTLGVRCLKGAELDTHIYTKEVGSFIDKNNNTLEEKRWLDDSDTSINRLTFEQATNYCNAKDMRLPTLFELQETLDTSPNFLAKDDFLSYWSSTPLPTDNESMMTVNFTTGGVLFSDRGENNHFRCVQHIDNIAPIITLNGASEITLHHDENYSEAGASATDDRDGNIAISISGNVDVSQVGDYTLTYQAIDKAGNQASRTRIIHIVDVTIPTLTLNGSATLVLNQGESYSELGAIAHDNVDTNLSIEITGNVDTTTPGNYTLTYTTQDSAGNTASITREVTIRDITPPEIFISGDIYPTLNQGDDFNASTGVSATDNVDGEVNVTIEGYVDTNIAGSYTITYYATDSSNNSVSAQRIIIVKDTTPPTITLNGSNPQIVYLGNEYIESNATANDNVALSGTIQIDRSTLNTNQIGEYSVTYTISDTSGNENTTTRVVNVVDNTKPIITLIGENPQTIEVKTNYHELGSTATDDGDGNITASIMIDASDVNTNILGTYHVLYNVTDSSQNSATETIRSVQVVDRTPPHITLIGYENISINQDEQYIDAGISTVDNYDTNITIRTDNPLTPSIVGVYTITYTATDSSGNSAQATRTVTVKDATPPKITIGGDNPFKLEVNTIFNEPGVSAIDNIDGEVNVTSSGLLENSSLGDKTITYTAKDKAGNEASTTRTVHIVDTTAPTITLLGENNIYIEVGNSYAELGAIVHDNYDNNLTVAISGEINISTLGTYIINYNATDSSGNVAIEQSRTITVQDTTAPTLTLTGDDAITINQGDTYIDDGATAMDNYDGDISNDISIVNPVDENTPGTYTITYDVHDSSRNNATQLLRTVTVIQRSTLTTEHILSSSLNEITTSRIGDLDNDGDEDIIILSSDGLSWYENSGDINTFIKHENIYSDNFATGVLFSDFTITDTNNDNLLDIHFIIHTNTKIRVTCNNNSDKTFACSIVDQLTQIYGDTLQPSNITVDIDKDGDMDQVSIINNSTVYIFEDTTPINIKQLPQTGDIYDGQEGGNYEFYRDDETDTVSESLTGLMWQDDNEVSNYTTDDTREANESCQGLTLGGYANWRLPNQYELYYLTQKGDTTIETKFQNFPQQANSFWTSIFNTVTFDNAYITNTINTNAVRCVRGDPVEFTFIRDDNQEVVLDKKHALMWDDSSNSQNITDNWDNAKNECQQLTTGDYSDWRLPNIHELISIFDDIGLNKAFQINYTNPLVSSTSDKADELKAYATSSSGLVSTVEKKSKVTFKCVRSIYYEGEV